MKRSQGLRCLPYVMNATTPIHPEALLSHLDFVRGIARSLLFDEHEVDDVVQQTWLQAVRRPPRTATSLKSWLGTVTRNLARNVRREKGRRRTEDLEQPPDVQVPSTAEVVEREAVRRQVVKAVLALMEPYRATILLRYFEGLSPARIAARLNVPGATVRTRLRRGLEQLRAMLDSAHGGNRQAWCLQLVPLAAFVPDPAPLALPAPGKATWIAAAAAAVLVTGAAVTWSVFGDPQDPVPAETAPMAGRQEPVAKARTEAVGSEAGGAEREQVVVPGEHPSVRQAMVGFRGRLVTPAGDPARGRIVKLAAFEPNRLFLEDVDPLAAESRAPRVGRASAHTAADGSFLVSGLWPRGNYLLWTDTQSADFLCKVVARSPKPGEVCDLGDLQLLAGVEITGSVQNQEGEPIEGALVWSSDLNGAVLKTLMFDQVDTHGGLIVHGSGGPRVHLFPGWFRTFGDGLGLPNVRTSKDGSFRLRGLPPGQCMLVVHADGHEPYMLQRLRLRLGPKDLGTIRLRDGEELLGAVTDAEGKPLVGAEVVVAPTGLASHTDLFGSLVPIDFARSPRRSDARGRFQVRGLPKGRVTVAVRRKPGDPWFVEPQVATAEELHLKLPRPVVLKVSLEGQHTNPVPRFKLMQGSVRGEVLLGALYRAVDLGGRCSRNGDGDYVISDLVPGTYTLITRAAGCVMTVDTVEVKSDLLLHVDLQPAKTVPVRVTDQRGQPVAGACVLARRHDAPAWSRSILLWRTVVPGWNALPENCGRTDEAGTLVVDSLPAGTVHLTVSHPAFGSRTKQVTFNGGPIHVVLEDPGSLGGRFLDGDLPADPDKWIVSVTRESGVDDRGPRGMRHLLEQRKDGSFQIGGLAPGDYEVEAVPNPRGVHSPNSLKDYVESKHFGFFVTRPSAKVTVHAGRRTQVVVNARPGHATDTEAGARISGTFLINGRPGQGCSVMYSDARNWFASPGDNEATKAQVDASGRFDLGRLRAGEYKLAAFDSRGAKIWTRQVTVAAGADDVLQVDVAVGGIQGVVMDPEGNPIRNIAVRLMQIKDDRVVVDHRVPTDAEGRFLAEAMPTGEYSIHAIEGQVGEAFHRGYGVTAGATSSPVTLHLTAYVAVKGTVDMKSFGIEGAESPTIALSAPRQWRQEKVEADGTFRIPKVLPGRYSVSVNAAIGKQATWVHGFGGTIDVGPQGAADLKITRRK